MFGPLNNLLAKVFKKSSMRLPRRADRKSILQVEALQERLVPATLAAPTATLRLAAVTPAVASVQLQNGDIVISGTAANDRAELSYRDGIWTVNLNGKLTLFHETQVTGGDVLFTGYEGDDFFIEKDSYLPTNKALRVIANGGAGNDTMTGAWANDSLRGGDGNDTLNGGHGNDFIDGQNGDDHLQGWMGNDTIYGGAGSNYIEGFGGNDLIYAGSDSNTNYVEGGFGDDNIQGGNGIDFLNGNGGNDIVNGGLGEDYLEGQDGNDLLIAGGDSDYNYLSGGAGNDELYGGFGDDYLKGGAGDDILYGSAGDDLIHGGTGNDELRGGSGDDLLYGGDGLDWILGEDGNDDLYGGGDDGHMDILVGGAGIDIFNVYKDFNVWFWEWDSSDSISDHEANEAVIYT